MRTDIFPITGVASIKISCTQFEIFYSSWNWYFLKKIWSQLQLFLSAVVVNRGVAVF